MKKIAVITLTRAKFGLLVLVIVARNIKTGEVFTEDNLTTKRLGTCILPMNWYDITGWMTSRNFSDDELIELE